MSDPDFNRTPVAAAKLRLQHRSDDALLGAYKADTLLTEIKRRGLDI